MSELREIIGDYDVFIDDITRRIMSQGFDIGDFALMDHICYRTESTHNYDQKKDQLQEVARLLGETMVNGRSISTFRLNEPIIREPWRVDAIELPAPKPGKPHKEGLEHAELVLFDDIPTFLSKYEGKPFDLRAADRGINPEIGLQLGEYSVKFHLLALPTVVYLEHKLGIDEVMD